MKRICKLCMFLFILSILLITAFASNEPVEDNYSAGRQEEMTTDGVYYLKGNATSSDSGNGSNEYGTESTPHVETDEERKHRKENELNDLIKKLLEDAKIEVIDWDMRMDEIGDYIDDNREDLGVPPDVDFSIGNYKDYEDKLPKYIYQIFVTAEVFRTDPTHIPGTDGYWENEPPKDNKPIDDIDDNKTTSALSAGVITTQTESFSLNFLKALLLNPQSPTPSEDEKWQEANKENKPIWHDGTEEIDIPGTEYWLLRWKILMLADGTDDWNDIDWTEDIEDQFVNKPNINDKFSDKVSPGTLPGTDITVYYPKDLDSLYELLTQYIKELQDLKISNSNITEYVTYNTTYVGQQIVHRYIPGTDYIFEVTNTSGMKISTTTHTNYTKILFRAPGTYRVRVYNVANAYRNNYLAGEKHTYYVINDGGYYDGLVVYHDSESFDGWLDEDTGPELVNVPLKKDGFDTTITQAMTNIVQLMDTTGNVLSPASDFTTERWS